MTASGLVFTPAMRGLRAAPARAFGSLIGTPSPPDADLGVVAQHEPVRRGLHRLAVDADILADQAVLDAVLQVDHRAALEDDAVLDLGVAHLDVVHDRRERADVGMDDPGAGADDGGTADDGSLDDGPRLDDHLPLDARGGVD